MHERCYINSIYAGVKEIESWGRGMGVEEEKGRKGKER